MKFRLICACLAGLLLCGCAKTPEEPTQPSASAYGDEVTTIVVTFQTMAESRTDDLALVQQAINEISVAKIGVAVEFRCVDAVDAFTDYPNWISNGETVDLMVLNYQDILTYISKGMILPIDDLLAENGSAILALEAQGIDTTSASIVDGLTYGVCAVSHCLGSGGGLWIPERYLQEADFAFDEKKVYSLEELGILFSRLKALYPDKYPLGQITSGYYASTMNMYCSGFDTLGTEVYSGAYKMGGEYTLENIFATEEYSTFLQFMRKWYKMGYIYPEAATTDASMAELIQNGVILSYPLSSQPGMISDSVFGEKVVCIRTTQVGKGTLYSKSGFWVIPKTSKDPQAAMKFLDLMFGDEQIVNLLSWGIEGVHYEFKDESTGTITFCEGQNNKTVGYYNPLGLYGDQRMEYVMEDTSLRSQWEEYTREAMENQSGLRGFHYSPENVNLQLSLLYEVVKRYVPILESGSVDPDVYYPRFLEELEQAGLAEVIADKQQQLDQWLAEQETTNAKVG